MPLLIQHNVSDENHTTWQAGNEISVVGLGGEGVLVPIKG